MATSRTNSKKNGHQPTSPYSNKKHEIGDLSNDLSLAESSAVVSSELPALEDKSLAHHQHASDHSHPHVHDQEAIKKVINRLSRVEGHIRGVKTMVQENRPCPEVLVQIAAVRGALDRIARMILDEHLTDCVARAAEEGNIETELAALKTALDRFLP